MENSDLTSSELLHSFLEGELDSALEPTLFADLNAKSELRAEMRDMLAVQRAVKRDRAALVPPIASTAAVFGALGMSTSMLVNSSWGSAIWSKIWAPLAAAVVSGAVTWYAAAPSSAEAPLQAVQAAAARNADPAATVAIVHDTVIVTKTQRVVVREAALADPVKSGVDDLTVTPSAPGTITPELVNDMAMKPTVAPSETTVPPKEVTEMQAIQTQPASITVRRVNPDAMLSATEVVNGTRELPDGDIAPRPFVRSFLTSLRSINASSYVNVSNATTTGSGLNNIALGIFYTFSDWFGAGVELGREPFAMSFKGVSDGTTMKYESTQDLVWGSVQAQLYPFPSLRDNGWQPFFQFNGGFTNYGFLTKGLFGTTFAPTAHLRMMFGFEATGLFYTVQGTSYTTPKLGFTYGIGYQL